MVTSCVASGCSTRWTPGGNIQFFGFPLRNPALLTQWVYAMKRKNFTPTRHSKLCSLHFVETDYLVRPNINVPRLREDAVPSVFAGFPSHNQPKAKKIRKLPKEDKRSDRPGPSQEDMQLPLEVSVKIERSVKIEQSDAVVSQELRPYSQLDSPGPSQEDIQLPPLVSVKIESPTFEQSDAVVSQELRPYSQLYSPGPSQEDIPLPPEVSVKIESPKFEQSDAVDSQELRPYSQLDSPGPSQEDIQLPLGFSVKIESPTFEQSDAIVSQELRPKMTGIEKGIQTEETCLPHSIRLLRKKVKVLNQKIRRQAQKISTLEGTVRDMKRNGLIDEQASHILTEHSYTEYFKTKIR